MTKVVDWEATKYSTMLMLCGVSCKGMENETLMCYEDSVIKKYACSTRVYWEMTLFINASCYILDSSLDNHIFSG